MSAAELTLPGAIPGLLRRGSPVHLRARHYGAAFIDGAGVLADVAGHVFVYDFGGSPLLVRASLPDLSLDLTDATGRAHSAWWLREQCHGRPCSAGPSWWYSALHGDNGWRLTHPATGDDNGRGMIVAHAPRRRPAFVPNHAALLSIPALADLDPDDPRLLPDGSRWVDAEALRRVVLHVHEATR